MGLPNQSTAYLVDESNNFTGEIIRMWDSENKQRTLDEFVKKYNVDLKNSYAYGDTVGDLSMLKMVGNPVAINPNREFLLKLREDNILRGKTIIIVERKDVIYKLRPDVEII